jgi:hypothetical protein
MTGRRNPFQTPEPAAASTIYDALRVASPHKRNRQWEKEHQGQKVVYRGVEPKLALQVKTISQSLRVPEGEVARALIEHALHAYADGDLDLNPRPNPLRMRMTLFPTSQDAPRNRITIKPRKRKGRESSWRVVTTWRGFPMELKQEISALASKDGLDVPVGELVSALLRCGLKSYDRGELKLEPVQHSTRFTLVQGG